MNRPPLSLIMCTRNRETQLGRFLSYLPVAALACACFEIILVDSASTDGTAALLAQHHITQLFRKRRTAGLSCCDVVNALFCKKLA